MKRLFLVIIASMLCCGILHAQRVRIMKGDSVVAVYSTGDYDRVVFSRDNGPEPPAGVEMVDLGLSVKWANMNVGATNGATAISWYGDYYGWGETKTRTNYTLSSCFDTPDGGTTFIKYNNTDGLTVLEPEDDAATANWGAPWRMPTKAEQDALLDSCRWVWTTDYNGVAGLDGYVITSKIPGYTDRSIFLPMAGYRTGMSVDYAYGLYWSSTLSVVRDSEAYDIGFNATNRRCFTVGWRYRGRSIRPVCE